MQYGKFVISLDFEIYWGVRDMVKLADYQEQLLGVRQAIPKILDLFSKYKIQATFATVGLLFFDTKEEMLRHLPEEKPSYTNSNLSPYLDLNIAVGNNEKEDPFHFGWSLVKKIQDAGQEIGSHTFGHYYCLEPGQTKYQFKYDISAAIEIAKKKGIEMKSLVFPRNQYNKRYISIIKEAGFTCFRGNQSGFMYNYQLKGMWSVFQRPIRLLDSYFNFSGHHVYSSGELNEQGLINVPSSHFLRPYSHRLRILEALKSKRILNSMSYAAKNNKMYHLWWHPHNFGKNLENNLIFLEKILCHYQKLNKQYGFESQSMTVFAKEIKNGKKIFHLIKK